ncbi:uncharacterized protein LOC143895834 isoform X2 [Temnothorax americanus]|uniref:uncharacterized protein LOC143895834 isoform X2 n=1 Tax=Temnothorax americanus TaxID=1964332 RepID=UPI004068B264
MDYGDNKSAKSRHIKSNSDDTVSPNLSKNFVTQVTKRKSIDDKRPFRGDSVNGQRLDSFESTVSPPKKRIKILQNVSVKPTIDFRKPREEVLRFMEELNELAKSKEKLANELYCQEYQLYLQREAKSSASDENDLRANIKSLIVKLEDTHKMYIKIENEYKTYLNEAGTINYNATEDNEKKNLELALFFLKGKIEDIETRRKKLQEMENEKRLQQIQQKTLEMQQLQKEIEELQQKQQPQQQQQGQQQLEQQQQEQQLEQQQVQQQLISEDESVGDGRVLAGIFSGQDLPALILERVKKGEG